MQASSVVTVTNANGTAQLARRGPCVLTAVRAWQSGLAADAYIQIFDAAAITDVTVGTTAPTWVVMLDFGAGEVSAGDGLPTHGLAIRNGLVVASTTASGNATGSTTQVRLGVL